MANSHSKAEAEARISTGLLLIDNTTESWMLPQFWCSAIFVKQSPSHDSNL